MIGIDYIRTIVNQYGTKIGIPIGELQIYDGPQGDGTPYIQVNGNTYFYIIEERGYVFEKRETSDFDTLLYWLMSDIVFSLASEYELNHRNPHQDSRRVLFEKELKLMQSLEPAWYVQKRKEIENTLFNSPYVDKVSEG